MKKPPDLPLCTPSPPPIMNLHCYSISGPDRCCGYIIETYQPSSMILAIPAIMKMTNSARCPIAVLPCLSALIKFLCTNHGVYLLSLLLFMVSEMEYINFISKAIIRGEWNEVCELHSQDHVTDSVFGRRQHSSVHFSSIFLLWFNEGYPEINYHDARTWHLWRLEFISFSPLRSPVKDDNDILLLLTETMNWFTHCLQRVLFEMSAGLGPSIMSGESAYEEAMTALSSLVTKRTRADKSNSGDRFDLLYDYIKILELEEPISKLKVIHVAGTKGKGSTCIFAESILRNCGFRTGLFTSPHLIDVRERFRLYGVEICKEKFLAYFWWCYDKLKVPFLCPLIQEKATDDVPMPTYFRFLALLAFKIFSAEEVDVAIMEVGLGGRFDATNVVQAPVVCGVSSLGYDHMEILGNSLGQIAGEKAGIFKEGVPAFTVPQPEEAMCVLEENASKLNVNLQVVSPLYADSLQGLQLGLDGRHQFVNAGLAVALCSTWLQRTGQAEVAYHTNTKSLPEEFVKGLTTASFQGRAQIVSDEFMCSEGTGDLVFYLDGAHSPESMEVCATWFSHAIKEDKHLRSYNELPSLDNSRVSCGLARTFHHSTRRKNSAQVLAVALSVWSTYSSLVLHIVPHKGKMESDMPSQRNPLDYSNLLKINMQILLFNCMSVRDPQLLLPRLMKTCEIHGVQFKQALFVPNISLYNKVITNVAQPDLQVDLSWQLSLQKYGKISQMLKKDEGLCFKETKEEIDKNIISDTNSKVFPTLPLAIRWLRDKVQQNRSARFRVRQITSNFQVSL
ncbi:hypothetical protein Cgig2_027648 [Carnegiea gigantea]|uniref:Folylpolyglutamate synthase n=1 Tax=Carnegiea gigantea TaxID=171969 RepID=A0A9Q1GPT3_9CARY|nr:hypothetical protein Cgig2_027648 [Carnegiea gigantea]